MAILIRWSALPWPVMASDEADPTTPGDIEKSSPQRLCMRHHGKRQ
jgi:hypothetical protein